MQEKNQKDWKEESRMLLQAANTISQDSNIIMLLCHSHRENPTKLGQINEMPLTDEGRLAAKEFGTQLPCGWNYRIFSSEMDRCKETAKMIEEGLAENGNTCTLMGCLRVLSGMAADGFQVESLVRRDKCKSVLKWAAGHYPETLIEPLPSYARRAANTIWSHHLQADPPTFDIFVSHDLHIMTLQFGWSGEWFQNEWVDYLGGFMLQLKTDNLVFYKNERQFMVPYPHWWPICDLVVDDRILPK